jgi:hypothetical protein
MKKKIVALVAALGISLAAITPASAWYGGWGGYGYGWGGYGAGLGIMAGAGLLGGIIGGAIANGGGYGYGYGGGYYGRPCYLAQVPYYDYYGNFVGYRQQTVC